MATSRASHYRQATFGFMPAEEEGLVTVRPESPSESPPESATKYPIPPPPQDFVPKQDFVSKQDFVATDKTRWIKPGESVRFGGVTIDGGMIYVGNILKPEGAGEGNDPCLINPELKFATHGNYSFLQKNQYWPDYANLNQTARRAYLNWLAEGRQQPGTAMCYVLLYFFGLERRVLIDAFRKKDKEAKAELPMIAAEIRRLYAVYHSLNDGENYIFLMKVKVLLDFIDYQGNLPKFYEKPLVPVKSYDYDYPLVLKIALGQAVADGVPIPAHLALDWIKYTPHEVMPTPMTRCPEMFFRLFALKYHEKFGKGLRLEHDYSSLSFSYRAASRGLGGKIFTIKFKGLGQVTRQDWKLRPLKKILQNCLLLIDSYSRFIGRHPDKADRIEGILLLPEIIWPDWLQQNLNQLQSQIAAGEIVTPAADFFARFNPPPESQVPSQVPYLAQTQIEGKTAAKAVAATEDAPAPAPARGPTRKIWLALAELLAVRQIKMLPDILAGERAPKLHEKIVLMRDEGSVPAHPTANPTANPTATAPQTKVSGKKQPSRITIDASKLAALRQEDQKLAAIFTPIFNAEDKDDPAPARPSTPSPAAATPHKNRLGLEDAQAKFLDILLTRPQWMRAEALQQAKKCHLMLDGALERINDAAFDHYDQALCEGDDPIDINPEVKERLDHDDPAAQQRP